MNFDNLKDNGVNIKNGMGFDDVMDNRDNSVDSIAYEVFSILDGSVIDGSDVGSNIFYRSFLDYMDNQGYDEELTHKVWKKIEEEYLY